jgi:chemotaxis protein methyltransferase CheR
MNAMTSSAELTSEQFTEISHLIYRQCGIHLKTGKEALVRARLAKRLRALSIGSIDAYMDLVGSDEGRGEIGLLVDAMTTNKTNFFREGAHFDFLGRSVLAELPDRHLRFWSAACSSGEEPYTLAMVLREALPDIDRRDFLVLATDISQRMLDVARQGVYSAERVREVPVELRSRYFERTGRGPGEVQVKSSLRDLVRLGWLNLMQPWPMKGPFHVIFCRNVMIYFDRPTQQKLVNRFWNILAPGGFLFVGHSEGLSAIKHEFRYVKPAVYRKR